MPTLAWLASQHPGSTIRTAIDAPTQRQVSRAVADHLAKLESSGVTAAAVVVLDTETSECLAAASLSRGSEQVDLTRRPRSTGSTLKPFIYAAAFQAGICTPDTVLEDAPVAWAGYEPSDYDRKFRGSMTAAEALAESRNIPAMVVLARVGVEPAVGVMEAAGLRTLARTPQRYGLSVAIGGAEATPMELAQGYAMLARGGISKDVQFGADGDLSCRVGVLAHRFDSARTSDQQFIATGHTVGEYTHPTSEARGADPRCLSSSACWQTLNALSTPDRTAAICPEAVKFHVAWKTGTSNGHRDAWCAAVTRHRTVVVWMGNAAGQASPALIGAEVAAPLALRMIASLDLAPGEPWPVTGNDGLPPEPPRRLAITSLSLISPHTGEQFAIDPDSPRQRQRVLLKASLNNSAPGSGTESRTLWWFADSQPIGVGDPEAQLWWQPEPGVHEIRVADAHGHAAVAQVVVK